MDTLSHIMVGGGIASLSMIDPVISEAGNSSLIYLACIAGSNAPDADYIYKLKGNSAYFRRHRGFSHSLIMIPMWALLITFLCSPFAEPSFLLHLFLWTYLSVQFHVITDIFNIHGTQALRPFTARWLSLDSIPLFDMFIFLIHAGGFCLMALGGDPGEIFKKIYLILITYMIVRLGITLWIKKYLSFHFVNAVRIKIIPSMNLWSYQVIIETEKDFLLGKYNFKSLHIETSLTKLLEEKEIHASLQNREVADFLYSTPFVIPKIIKRKNLLEVRWLDLRFRKRNFYPFMAVCIFDTNFEKERVYAGWMHSPYHIKRKLSRLRKVS